MRYKYEGYERYWIQGIKCGVQQGFIFASDNLHGKRYELHGNVADRGWSRNKSAPIIRGQKGKITGLIAWTINLTQLRKSSVYAAYEALTRF